jgi:hypothetical protein
MPPLGFEPTILVSERPKTHSLDRTATGIGPLCIYWYQINTYSAPDGNAEHWSLYPETTSESKWIMLIKVNIHYRSFTPEMQIRTK